MINFFVFRVGIEAVCCVADIRCKKKFETKKYCTEFPRVRFLVRKALWREFGVNCAIFIQFRVQLRVELKVAISHTVIHQLN